MKRSKFAEEWIAFALHPANIGTSVERGVCEHKAYLNYRIDSLRACNELRLRKMSIGLSARVASQAVRLR